MSVTGALYIARHAATDWNESGRLVSTTDIPLSPAGVDAATRLAQELAGKDWARAISSPSQRATATAERILLESPSSVELELDPRVRETDFGPFEGRSPADLVNSGDAESFASWRDPTNPGFPPGAETHSSAEARAREVFAEVADVPGDVLLVTHGVFARILLATCVLGMNPALFRRLRLDNAHYAVVEWEDAMPRLVSFNVGGS